MQHKQDTAQHAHPNQQTALLAGTVHQTGHLATKLATVAHKSKIST